MSGRALLFVDRDGTLIAEPADYQVDGYEKFKLVDGVIPALLRFAQAGYALVMVSNQDGLGTATYSQASFDRIQALLLQVFNSQGIAFEQILICPHTAADGCDCRKPKTAMLSAYLSSNDWDRSRAAVVGDRVTDLELAKNLGVRGFQLSERLSWRDIADEMLLQPRRARVSRKTKETKITISVDLDTPASARLDTGIGFFDHMLEQLSKHGGISLKIAARGDLHIDQHHTVEDVALALGAALREALGDKRGIGRYGFLLPMDESQAQVALDLSGRSYFVFEGKLHADKVGELATELVPHFFRSLADALGANLHIRVTGENTHHQIEAMFKAVARTLKQAIARDGDAGLPSTKGAL